MGSLCGSCDNALEADLCRTKHADTISVCSAGLAGIFPRFRPYWHPPWSERAATGGKLGPAQPAGPTAFAQAPLLLLLPLFRSVLGTPPSSDA